MTTPRQLRSTTLRAGMLGLAALLCYVLVDPVLKPLVGQDMLAGDLKALLHYLSAFGHGTGCLVAVLLIWNLDRNRRRGLLLVLASVIPAGLFVSAVKIVVHRPRPFYTFDGDITLAQSFSNNAMQSFPSGHTASAFALAAVLALLYPQGKSLFFGLAIITGLQRVVSQAHFLSDVFAGAAIGLLSAALAVEVLRMWGVDSRHADSATNAETSGAGKNQESHPVRQQPRENGLAL